VSNIKKEVDIIFFYLAIFALFFVGLFGVIAREMLPILYDGENIKQIKTM
jgi:hypothetical protein